MTSLREWAVKNEVWKPESWKVFLENDLVPFYKMAWTLNNLYLSFIKICEKPALVDIEDEKLKNKVRVAIYGGVEQDPENSFAKFMYEYFGICAENASSFEESIEHYRSWGDGIKVSITKSWIRSIPIGDLTNKLHELIIWISGQLGVKLSDIGLKDSYPYGPLESVDVTTLLPEPGEEPKELISLINKFRQKAVDLAIGANPFTTFIYYTRAIPMPVLMNFLGRDINDVTNLTNFLGLKAYSTIDIREIRLPTNAPDKVFLVYRTSGTYEGLGLACEILRLQEYLQRVEPTAKEVFEKMVKDAVDQIQFSFDPWQDYEPIFSFWNELLKKDIKWCDLAVEGGRISKITSYYGYEKELQKKIWLQDLLIKLYPAISTGIVDMSYLTSLFFSSYAKKWVEKVIEREGKT